MKGKIIALLLTAGMVAFSMTGCGGSSSFSGKETSSDNVSTSSAEPTPDESSEVESTPESEITPTEEPESEINSIEEQVILDESNVKITATELDFDGLFGPGIKILIENNSDTDLIFQTRNSSVNGYMIESSISTEVAAGKKAYDTISFMATDLTLSEIEVLSDFEFSFHIFNAEDWATYLDTAPIQIKTAAAETYQYTYNDSGDELYNGNGIRIISKGWVEDSSIFGSGLMLYMENTSDKAVTVQVQSVSVNGFMVDTIFSADIVNGKHMIDDITFESTSLEENNIEKVQDIEFSFHIFDSDSWDTVVDTDVISITLE